MNLVRVEDQPALQEICALFTEAERAIKEVEDTGGELIVPAVNQLRYTGNHLIRYLSDPAVEESGNELADAIKHCKRATYDAYEAAILNQLMEFKKFKDDYRKTQITTIIPDFPTIAKATEMARQFARNNNQSKTRGEQYHSAKDHLHIIVENIGKLDACRDELNKQISKERRNFLWMLFGMVIAAVGAVAAVLQYLGC
jgi:hypothetical protein